MLKLMTKEALAQKISELEYWLTTNANHENYSLVLQDKKDLEFVLNQMENDGE